MKAFLTRGIALLALVAAAAGCATQSAVVDRHHPEIAVCEDGAVTWRGERVALDDVADLLEEAGYVSADTVNIRIPDDLRDYRVAYALMKRLRMRGYTRPVLVTGRIATSEVTPRARPAPKGDFEQAPKKTIRYK